MKAKHQSLLSCLVLAGLVPALPLIHSRLTRSN